MQHYRFVGGNMLGNVLSKYMMKQLTTQKVPTVYPEKCMNVRQRRMRCQECVLACQQDALVLGRKIVLKEEKCTNCNRCAAVCPSVTFVPRTEVLEPLYQAIQNKEKISITCSKSNEKSSVKVGCLCELPWEFFAYIALDRQLLLDCSNCEECEEKQVLQFIQKNIARLKEFFGEDRFSDAVTVVTQKEESLECQYTRRELLTYLAGQGKQKATFFAPFLLNQNEDARIYRSLLVSKVQRINKEQKLDYGWSTVALGRQCYGCGVCEKLCPQNAISIKEEEGNHYFIHHFGKCTHCGICKVVCNQKAIELTFIQKDGSQLRAVYKIDVEHCKVCNDPIPPSLGGCCEICKRKLK